jgi:hypothetical protein
MKFARPQEFLDLCERLKETKPAFEAVKFQVLDLKLTMTREQAQGLFFEYLVGDTITRIAKDYGARPLQLEDAYLFEPYELQLWGYGCKLNDAYIKITNLEADIVLKAGPSQIWVFEAKSGKYPNLYKSKLINALCGMKLQFSFANVTLGEKYKGRSESIKEYLEENGIVTTYLPITRQELCEFVEDVTPQLPPSERSLSPAEKYLGDFYKPEKRAFARPQEFLDLCEKLKETKPDLEAVKMQVLDLRRTIRHNTQDLIFEYLVGNAITKIAKDYGARRLQPEDADLFEPYKLQLLEYGCKLNWAYSKNNYLEADIVLKAGPSQIWIFEAKSGKESELINPKFTNKICNMNLQFSFANVTLREKYEARRKSIKNYLEKSGIVITCLPITKQELCEFVEDVSLAEECLQRCFRDLLPAQGPLSGRSADGTYLGNFYKPKKNG